MDFVKVESRTRDQVYFMAKCECCGLVEKGIQGIDTPSFWESFQEVKCKQCGESTKSVSQGVTV